MKYKHKLTGDVINDVTYESLSYLEQEEYDYYHEESLVDDILNVGIAAVIFGSIGGDVDISSSSNDIEFGGGSFGGAGAGGDW